jgi:hypothetical protein
MAVNINKETVYRAAKAKEKDFSINDGGGLFLFVGASGSKLWRFVYQFEGKREKIAFGAYPDTSLEHARRKAEEARMQIANNINPSQLRKQVKSVKLNAKLNENRINDGLPILGSFADVSHQWLNSVSHLTKANTNKRKKSRIERYAFPILGNKPINEIKSSEVLAVLKPIIDKLQLETAHRLHGEISSIFAYGIIHNYTDYDPAQPVAKQIPAQKVKHRAALIDPKQVAQLLRDISNYQGTFVVQSAFRLSPMLFQRPGEIRQMLWDDIDLETQEW